jgi:glycosyltransferase involved in cell wall biosynthesis
VPVRSAVSHESLRAPLVVVIHAREPAPLARCLRALLGAVPADVPLLAGGTDTGRSALETLCDERYLIWLDAEGTTAWNAAATLATEADLLLLDEATEIGPHLFADLGAIASAQPDAATITPLTNDGAFLSVPHRNLPWPLLDPRLTLEQAADRVRESALGLHPRTPIALAHCVLLRRPALDLVGPFDPDLAPTAALNDFCERATAAGLEHVVADEVLVAHRGAGDQLREPVDAGSFPAAAAAVRDAADDRFSGLARALLVASVALEPLEVTIDARVLGPGVTGTTVHVAEILAALAERDDVRVRVLLPERIGDEAGDLLDRLSARVERIGERDVRTGELARSHVVHRPWQIESVVDMAFLDHLGERTLVTHQDLIGYRTAAAFASIGDWQSYRRTTADALALAAMVLFFSPTAMADALAEDLVAPERARVVVLGAGPRRFSPRVAPRTPTRLSEHERPFLLVLGNRFRHKNTRFAMELLGALRDRHSWDGDLVLAGAEVLYGSGSGEDAAWLLRHPAHAPHVVELGAVHEDEKEWLLAQAAAVVYPSTYEGFGLIPFEAAQAGTPCLVAPVSALRDTVPETLALLVPWDAEASARRCIGVLTDPTQRTALVDGLREAAAALTWDVTAAGLVEAYHAALALPAPAAARIGADLARAEHEFWTIRNGIPDEAWPLVRPDDPQIDRPLARDLSDMLGSPGGRNRLMLAMRIARRLPRRG